MPGLLNAKKQIRKSRRVFRQIFWTLFGRALLIAAGFISSIITARVLGPEGRGIFFYWTSLSAVIIQFGNLGLHSSNIYYLAKEGAKLSTLAANSLWVSLVIGTILSCGVLGIVWYRESEIEPVLPFLLPALLMVPAGLYFLLGSNLLVALGRIGEYNGFEVANRYVGLGAILLAAWLWGTPESLISAVAITAVVMCFPLFWRILELGGSGSPSLKVIRKGFGYAFRAYLASVFGFLVLRLNVFVLEHYVKPQVLGDWSIAAQLLDVINVIPGTIALVLLPRLMRSDDPYSHMRSQVKIVALLLVGIVMLVGIFGADFIRLIYGEEFAGVYHMLMWGIPGVIGLGLISIISQYLAVNGIPVALIWAWALGFMVEVGLALYLVPLYGGVGAMLSLSVAYSTVLISLMILVSKVKKRNMENMHERRC